MFSYFSPQTLTEVELSIFSFCLFISEYFTGNLVEKFSIELKILKIIFLLQLNFNEFYS